MRGRIWVLKETVLFQARCVLFYVCTIPALSSNNQFLGVLDALEWWERKSSDTQPSRNESIKWLPQRNCCIFKCLWEYLPSLSAFPPLAAHQHLEDFAFDLCYQFVVQCGAQSCEMAVWSCRMAVVEISLPLLKILTSDLQLPDSSEDLTTPTQLHYFSGMRRVDMWLLDATLQLNTAIFF